MKISASIITFNEEKNISKAIESVQWTDEIVVVDSESSDRTREIAGDLGARVFTQEWPGFGKQKQFAVSKCKNQWILSLDADEVISEELKKEILLLDPNDPTVGYKIPRLSFYMGKPIKHSGWYPDYQLRLFQKNYGNWKDRKIHESVKMQPGSKVEKLKNDIYHYSVRNAAHHHQMIGERYAPLSAQLMFEKGRKTSPLKITSVGLTTFIKTFFLQGGFLDGFPGFCISRFAAHHAFLKHLILWEIQKKQKKREN